MITACGIAINSNFLYHSLIILLSLAFLIAMFVSIIRHRKEINFSTIILRKDDDGTTRLSKVGITFLFLILLLIYQTVSPTATVDPVVSNLLLITFATELSNKVINILPVLLNRKKELLEDEKDGSDK